MFSNNTAPYGAIMFSTNTVLQLAINSSRILDNIITTSGGTLYFSNIYSSNIVISNSVITLANSNGDITYSEFYVIDFEESDVSLQMSNCSMTVTGQLTGSFIYAKGVLNLAEISASNISYNSQIYTYYTNVLTPKFSLFNGDNFQASFDILAVNKISLDQTPVISLNCNPNILNVNYACKLEIYNSIVGDSSLSGPFISIATQTTTLSSSLTMLSVTIQNTTFVNISWSDGTTSGIVSSSTKYLGRSPGMSDYAVNLKNCTFSGLNGTGGLIYNGVESNYDLVLCLLSNTIDSVYLGGTSALIYASDSELTSFQSNLNSSSLRNISILVSKNNFTEISQQSSIQGGRIIYWESQVRGIYVNMQNNIFLNINCSEGSGAIVSASYGFNLTQVLNNGDLSPEYQVMISSAYNVYQNISGESGAVLSILGDTRLLKITFSNDSMKNINSVTNGGVLEVQYNTSTSTATSSRILHENNIFEQSSSQKIINSIRSLTQTGSNIGNITIFGSSFESISANNGGLIYETSPIGTLLLNVTMNNFTNFTAVIRGGVFYLNQPSVLINQNYFDYATAGLAGMVFYSSNDKVNVFNLNLSNTILPTDSTPVSFGPTNLRVVFTSIVESTILVADNLNSPDPLTPLITNLTSYSPSQYMMSFTLVYQRDRTNFKNFIMVPDQSQNCLLNITFYMGHSVSSRYWPFNQYGGESRSPS